MAGTDIDVGKLSRAAMTALRWRLRATRAAIALERGAQAFWPVIALTLVILAVLRLGPLAGLGQTWAMIVLGGVGLLWLVLFAIGVRRFHWPTQADARNRMDATLPGRPLQTLEDKQAIGESDVAARYLWARHLQRMAEQARQSKAAQPLIRLAARDPWAVRLMAILLFAAAMIFGRSDPVQSLVDSIAAPAPVVATGPSWEGWAEPPAYTGKPSVYLNDAMGQTLKLPQGTAITLRVYGATQDVSLSENVTQTGDAAFTPDDSGLAEVGFSVQKSGDVVLTPPGGEETRFRVSMIPDAAPTIELAGEITRTVQGEFQMPFRAQDDYGVTGGEVTITLSLPDVDRRHGLALDPEPRDPVTLDLPMPFSRNTQEFEETVVEDLATHPWAGLPVVMTLTVTDDLGQEGSHSTEPTPMPGKRFFDTTAGALAEMRRDLLWNRANAPRVRQLLKAITWKPEDNWEGKPEKAYLMVRTAIRRMEYNLSAGGLTAEVRDEVAELLWNAAILIEDGDLGDARERLRRAQERLSEAMKNGATQDEIQQLMDELRRATNDYIRQLAEEQRRDGQQNQQAENQNQQTMSADQLQQMMDRIQELMEQGRMDEAQQLMQQLQEMMENMRVTEGGQGQGQNDQAMEGLGDTLREQQDLADETFRQLQEEFQRNRQQGQQNQQGQGEGQDPQLGENQGGGQSEQRPQQGQGQGQQRQGENQPQRGQGQGQGLDRSDLAERQRALRDMLSEQRRQFQNEGVEGGEGFGQQLDEAERQMGRAEEALRDGDEGEALDRQADAMEALREGIRNLNEAQRQAQNQQGGQQGQQAGRPGRQQRDPLGRPLSENGEIGTDERLVPGEEAYRRSREVMDEIRRRSGDRTRPQIELDYLRRLLDRF